MKRPVLIAAAGLICGCMLAAGQIFWGFILAVLAVIICLTFKVCGKIRLPLIFYVIFLCLGYLIMRNAMSFAKEMEAIEDDTVITVTGRIDDVEEGDYGLRLYLKMEGGTCIVNLYDEGLKYLSMKALTKMLGNTVRVTGKKKDFMEAANQGNFSEKEYCYSKGIFLKINGESLEVTNSEADELKIMAYRLRERLSKTLSDICPDETAGVLMAIIYGDKGQLDEKLKENFADGGISHILVVSGVKMLSLVSPYPLKKPVNWAFMRLHIAESYIISEGFSRRISSHCPSWDRGDKSLENNLAKVSIISQKLYCSAKEK